MRPLGSHVFTTSSRAIPLDQGLNMIRANSTAEVVQRFSVRGDVVVRVCRSQWLGGPEGEKPRTVERERRTYWVRTVWFESYDGGTAHMVLTDPIGTTASA